MIGPTDLPFQDLIAGLSAIRHDGGGFDAVVKIAQGVKATGTVYFIGNGGSAAICSHMATDWGKNGGFRAMCFSDGSLLTCLANDLGYERSFSEPINRFGKREDMLFAISSSGQSQNILWGAQAAIDIGMAVMTLSGFRQDNPLRRMGSVNFYVPSHHYGTVEIAHLAICHHVLDQIIEAQE